MELVCEPDAPDFSRRSGKWLVQSFAHSASDGSPGSFDMNHQPKRLRGRRQRAFFLEKLILAMILVLALILAVWFNRHSKHAESLTGTEFMKSLFPLPRW